MKNIAIFGSARSGKSTLSKMILKEYPNYDIIIGDDIRWAFEKVLPGNKINSSGGEGMVDDFPRFLSSYFYKSIKRNKGEINYILDTCDIKPEKAIELFSSDDTIILFLGTPNQSVEEHFNEIRKYETEKDWTYNRSDNEIIEHSKYWIPESKRRKNECEKLGIWYVDTSLDRNNVLKETFEKLKELLGV